MRGLAVALLLIGLAACSSDDTSGTDDSVGTVDTATTETDPPVATPFATVAPSTTSTTIDPNAPTTPPPTDAAGGVVTTALGGTLPPPGVCVPGTYAIEAGDFPLRVSEKFDVTVEALGAANANTPGYSAFIVGVEIVIPC